MRYVLLDDVLDPGPYLRALPGLKDDLPPGSFRFASDGDHYDFRGERCVHDLEFGRLSFSDEDSGVVELELIGNQWKHDGNLILRYWDSGRHRSRPTARSLVIGPLVTSSLTSLCRSKVA